MTRLTTQIVRRGFVLATAAAIALTAVAIGTPLTPAFAETGDLAQITTSSETTDAPPTDGVTVEATEDATGTPPELPEPGSNEEEPSAVPAPTPETAQADLALNTTERFVAPQQLTSLLTVSDAAPGAKYARDRFEHWIDTDRDGCNTRYEVLIRSATVGPYVSSSCKLSDGLWTLAYSGITATDPIDIEVDHVVALSEAWRSGAWKWDDTTRRAFANDLDVDYALVPTDTASNQAKSDKDPSSWVPQNEEVCEYLIDWSLIKIRWGLTIDSAEKYAVDGILAGCESHTVELPPLATVSLEPSNPDPAPSPDPYPGVAPFSQGMTRLAGSDRYSTAIATSQRFPAGAPAVYVADGSNFPDALAAAAAAAHLGAPLLLTPKATLPSAVANELKRLQPERIIVAGGTGAVSATVERSLAAIAPVTRHGGTDRYATGLQITRSAFASSQFAVIASGRDFPDALAATGVAGKRSAPVILVDGKASRLSSGTTTELKRLGVTSVLVAGGSGAVSTGIEKHLREVGISVTRKGGADRFATAALINTAYFPAGSSDTMFLANGMTFPDALAGAALAGQLSAPLFITQQQCVPAPVHASITALAASRRVILGGTGAVSSGAANLNRCATSQPKPTAPKPTTPKPQPKPQPPKPQPPKPQPPKVSFTVTPGAFCKKVDAGKIGYTKSGTKMMCKKSASDSRLRWRAV